MVSGEYYAYRVRAVREILYQIYLSSVTCHLYKLTNKQVSMKTKSMTRQQLADYAGVDVRTLRNWIEPHRKRLIEMGMPEGKGALPPNVVKWIIHNFDIDTP